MSEYVDYELAEDTKALLNDNVDVTCIDDNIKKKIFSAEDSTLFQITKTINSPITIVDVKEVTDDLIKDL